METKDCESTVRKDIPEPIVSYSPRIVELYRELGKGSVGLVLGRQFFRSGTAVGANVHEAKGGQSKADFIVKISIAHNKALDPHISFAWS